MYTCIMVKHARKFDLLYKLELVPGLGHSSAAIANFKSIKEFCKNFYAKSSVGILKKEAI